MGKRHKYPRYEEKYIERCCTFQQSECGPSCFCRSVGCGGVWTMRADIEFKNFLAHFCQLWVRGASAFSDYIESEGQVGIPPRWRNAVLLLRKIGRRWSNWDGHYHSLPSLVNKIRRCYFCDDSFQLINPFVREIRELSDDTTGVFTSKLVSQLFYDIAVPFDTGSAKSQKACGYAPRSYGDGIMRIQAKDWLLANNKSVDDFRKLDGAPESCWSSPGRGTTCSRVLDKLFYS